MSVSHHFRNLESGPVQNLSVSSEFPSSPLNITWMAPDMPNGEIISYSILVYSSNDNQCVLSTWMNCTGCGNVRSMFTQWLNELYLYRCPLVMENLIDPSDVNQWWKGQCSIKPIQNIRYWSQMGILEHTQIILLLWFLWMDSDGEMNLGNRWQQDNMVCCYDRLDLISRWKY